MSGCKCAHSQKHHPCQEQDLLGPPVEVKSVGEVDGFEDLILNCMPAFGAAYIRRIYCILDRVIGAGVPLIVAVAGPVTVSNQHRAWLIPLLNTGWVAYITTTDAACYHDGHDSLHPFGERPLREVAIEGKDLEYGEANIIRVTDVGFKEEILYEQDRFFTAMFRQPEFQRKMTGTEFRNLVGKYYAAQETANGIRPGLLSTCWKNGIPVFVGSPGDGSAFLNSVKLWALKQLGKVDHAFEIDVHAEVFESCAYHYWGLTQSEAKQIAVLILGGGVPKNFTLQPEPTLSQIFLLPGIRGYDYDVQLVGAPVTDGSLTSCKPQEAYTWGKVSAEALRSTVESYQTDYSPVMPLIVAALLEKKKRLVRLHESEGLDAVPLKDRGYLRDLQDAYYLFHHRSELTEILLSEIGREEQLKAIMGTFEFPLKLLDSASGLHKD